MPVCQRQRSLSVLHQELRNLHGFHEGDRSERKPIVRGSNGIVMVSGRYTESLGQGYTRTSYEQ